MKGTNPYTKRTYILKKERLHELPGGLTMMIPTEFGPMIRTGLLSWPAKARMGLDFLLPQPKMAMKLSASSSPAAWDVPPMKI